MPRFSYTATLPTGQPTHGSQKAASREAVELALYERELRNIHVAEYRSVLQKEILAPRVKRTEVMHLSRQLGAFIRAGLPLIEAVHTIGAESDNSSVRRMMLALEQGLRRGDRLSDCLDRHRKIFPEFYRGIVRSAELTGQLDVVLDQLASYLERDLEARRKVKSAMVYPTAIAMMAVVTVVVLSVYVLPRFKTFFASLGAKLPLPTRMLLAVTGFLTDYWWLLLSGVLVVSGAVYGLLHTRRGRYLADRLLLRIPVLGVTLRYVLVERFARILSSMVGAGVNLPDALRVASESLRNTVFVRALHQVSEAMLHGEGLAGPLAATGVFPSTAARMIRVGEETGTLDDQLAATAKYYEGELDYKIKKLTSLFEPAVIVVMGGLVGFVAIALVSAMYGIFNQVKV
ncbi:MAG TPA: type II secretion system F family protein [Jatrophihabitans sp.]|nr:type II secretion system F family protein [Jatrophihabitans sp.]